MKDILKLILIGIVSFLVIIIGTIISVALSSSDEPTSAKYYDEDGEVISLEEKVEDAEAFESIGWFFKYPFVSMDFDKFMILLGSVSIFISYAYVMVKIKYGEADFLSNWAQYIYSFCLGVFNWLLICHVYYIAGHGRHFWISVGISSLIFFLAGTRTGNLILGGILLAGSSDSLKKKD